MPSKNVVVALLHILNMEFKTGRPLDNNNRALWSYLWHELLSMGLVAEYDEGRCQWYVHENDKDGLWEN